MWGLLVSGLSFYLWRENQGLKKVNETLSKSNEAYKRLVANEYKSYQTINDCFVLKKGLCNPEDFKTRLQVLGDEADGLYDQIHELDQQLKIQKP